MYTDEFLLADDISNESDAARQAIRDALQHNLTYTKGLSEARRKAVREEWAQLLRSVVRHYAHGKKQLSDTRHCKVIAGIGRRLSTKFPTSLVGGHLRFGTSQKALNVYLKYLWRMKIISIPPHCPVDSIMLAEARIKGTWTRSDNADEYLSWIHALRLAAGQKALPEWEYEVWLTKALKKRRKGKENTLTCACVTMVGT